MHETAVLRLTHSGAVPNTAKAMFTEWFRDLKSPQAESVRNIYDEYFKQLAPLKSAPKFQDPKVVLQRMTAKA